MGKIVRRESVAFRGDFPRLRAANAPAGPRRWGAEGDGGRDTTRCEPSDGTQQKPKGDAREPRQALGSSLRSEVRERDGQGSQERNRRVPKGCEEAGRPGRSVCE